MKRHELLPTESNLIQTYIDDPIERDKYVNDLVTFLSIVEGDYALAIDSQWGSGKTFYVKQVKMVIDSLNPQTPFASEESGKKVSDKWMSMHTEDNSAIAPMITAYYDAWEHDDDNDPLLSLIYEIMKENYCIEGIPNKRNWTAILSEIVTALTNCHISSLVEAVNGEDLFQNNRANEELRTQISTFFQSLLPENGNKLIVFIDELDRCSPVYAIKLLERIKHYLENESVVFVFSINRIELQKTIRKFYGEDFDACRYLDRFFDRSIGLPSVDLSAYCKKVGVMGNDNLRQTTCNVFMNQANLSLRDSTKYLEVAKAAAFEITDGNKAVEIRTKLFDKGTARLLAYSVIVPIALGLKMINTNDYQDFITGKNDLWLERIVFSDELFVLVFQYLMDGESPINSRDDIPDDQAKSKIKELYDAIFVYKYDDWHNKRVRIGSVTIDKFVKTEIIEAVNQVSKYTNLNR